MATIFPPSPSVDDEYQGYKWDGTTWNLIGNQYNPTSYSASAPANPKPGDLWIESDVDVPSISPETILTTTAAASTYQPLVSGVSDTEIGYLDGVTSAIQIQLDSKAVAGTGGVPYRMAAGTGTFSGANGPLGSWYYSNAATVTLPSGRFSVTPIVNITAQGSGMIESASISDLTSTYFTFYVSRLNAVPGGQINWTAVQMASGAASG